MHSKRKVLDGTLKGMTIGAALTTASALFIVFYFVFTTGFSLLSFDLLVTDYNSVQYNAVLETPNQTMEFEKPEAIDSPFSYKYGIALEDTRNKDGESIISIAYVDDNSPLKTLLDKESGEPIEATKNNVITRISYEASPTSLTREGAASMAERLDSDTTIREIIFIEPGGGIRGSIIATLYLIGLTLVMALPLGIFSAIYLNEFAKDTRLTRTIRSFIDTLTGIPSIVYGLMAVSVFIPITARMNVADGLSIYAGAMTMAVILLPILIRTTEESLAAVPNEYREASLALGANDVQTTFKVVLPNALAGLLTATFLSIGRIIGESAALIFVMGTAVKDSVDPANGATTLAVHIWTLMSTEPANVELASTIAVIILTIVLILNTTVKLLAKKFDKIGNR